MSYPDEYEASVEAMYADLARRGALPDSIRMMDEAATREIANGALTRSHVLMDAIFAKQTAPRAGDSVFVPVKADR